MDMAEKDDTEGRCPAYRTPYNKVKKCERFGALTYVTLKVVDFYLLYSLILDFSLFYQIRI